MTNRAIFLFNGVKGVNESASERVDIEVVGKVVKSSAERRCLKKHESLITGGGGELGAKVELCKSKRRMFRYRYEGVVDVVADGAREVIA